MRDHRKLVAFTKARELALEVYRATSRFPREELFGLTSQIRRSAVSVPSNLVEGCARQSERDYLRFLDMALGSACELEFQLDLARELGFLGENGHLIGLSQDVARLVSGLVNARRQALSQTPESPRHPEPRSPQKPEARSQAPED
ncbi:MAG: four helix bundle protein [Geothrix sp.]|nr:four helix bundle protein [Geothrix sp.]